MSNDKKIEPSVTVDTPEFQELAQTYALNFGNGYYRKPFIAHIDAHTARAVAAAVGVLQADLKTTRATIRVMDKNKAAMQAEIDALRAAQPVAGELPPLYDWTRDGMVEGGTSWVRLVDYEKHAAQPVQQPAAVGVHDLEMQQYIGARLRRVATAAGVTVDYGDDEFYYAGAFSILGDIARTLEKPAAGVQGSAWGDAMRRCGANPDYHGLIAFRRAQLERFIDLLRPLQPDSGRDAALVDRINLLHGAYITRETKTTGANGWLLRNEHGLVRALNVFESEFVDCALASHPAPSSDAGPVAYCDPAALVAFSSERKKSSKNSGPYARKWMWANPAEKLIPLYAAHPANGAQAGLSDEQIDQIARSYFAEDYAQTQVKNAIHDAFQLAAAPQKKEG